jgi:phosphohistidine swiveling domain-containing protein
MNFVKSFKEIIEKDYYLLGGKGSSLVRMFKNNIPVPDGFIVLSSTFDYFLENNLSNEIESILVNLDYKNIHDIDEASGKIRKLIENADIQEDIIVEILERYKELKSPSVAVRSSASVEDNKNYAWAGQLESYLNIPEDKLLENIKKCWSSLFTSRAIFYRFENKLQNTKISMAVIIQTMIQSEISGVAFSVHPITENPDEIIIESTSGLGESIVSGEVTPDSYIIQKSTKEIKTDDISENKKLNKIQLIELSDLIIKIENYFDFPCDIEWSYLDEKFYILQSRPITTIGNSRKFQKFFTREIPLITIEYWWEGEFNRLREILKGATHFNPLFVRRANGLTDIYYDMNNSDTALEPLFQYFEKNPDEFETNVNDFEKLCIKLNEAISSDSSSPVEIFDDISKAWSYLPIWVQIGSTELRPFPSNFMEKSRELRDKFQEIEYKAGEKLIQEFKNKYPELSKYANLVTFEEFIKNSIPSIQILKDRMNGFIFFEGKVLENKVDEFSEKYNVQFIEDLAIIGETEWYKKANNMDVTIKGRTAYPGKVNGKVNIIMTKDKIDTIQDGEILVTPMTSPDYLPALKKAKAFVTDEGGITSHAAIIARELKKPCVVGTKFATKKLKTGDLVEVDANNGIVRILD